MCIRDSTYTYDVTDSSGGSVAQSATITITGTDDVPIVTGAVTGSADDTDGVFTVDLLSGASEADAGDTLTITGLTSSGDTSGITLNTDNTLSVDPTAYASLPAGTTEVITYSYNVEDTSGNAVAQTASVTITGTNDVPTITGDIVGAIAEDGSSVSGALSVTDVDSNESAFQAETVSGNYGSVTIDAAGAWTYTIDNTLAAIQSLGAGESASDTVTVRTADGTTKAITITISGTNDVPTVSGVVTGSSLSLIHI